LRPSKPTLASRIAQLNDYRKELRQWLDEPAPGPWDRARLRVLERMVQLLVECAADAGDLWLEERGRPLGESATGVFQNLHREGVMDAEMLARFQRYVSTRNRIVHDYDLITPQRVRQDAEGLAQDVPLLVQALLTA